MTEAKHQVIDVLHYRLVQTRCYMTNKMIFCCFNGYTKISTGTQIFGVLPKPRPPPILVLKVVFGKLLPKPKLCIKVEVVRFNGCRNNSGSQILMVLPTMLPTQRYTDAWASLAPLWLNLTKSGVSKDSVSPPSSEYTPLLCSR